MPIIFVILGLFLCVFMENCYLKTLWTEGNFYLCSFAVCSNCVCAQANDETAILSNLYGSARYVQFLEGLGTLIRLKDIDPNQTYSGGLETGGSDGQFTYSWQDEAMHGKCVKLKCLSWI